MTKLRPQMMHSRFVPITLSAAVALTSFATCTDKAKKPQEVTVGGGGSGGGKKSAKVSFKEVDTSALTPREKREWSRYVKEMLSPCSDTPVPIAQCIQEKRKCAKCVPAAKFLVSQVRNGRVRNQVAEAYKARFDNELTKSVNTSDTPMLGPATAAVKIVEWADFQCPHCRLASPILENTVKMFPGRVSLYFKMFPLRGHSRAEPAAKAAFAAEKQGKFWPMHHKLFENQQALEDADLLKYAKEMGLDGGKFSKDMKSEAAKARIARDKKQAEAVGLEGTPLIYINGREFLPSGGGLQQALQDWVSLELEMNGKDPTPVAVKSTAKPAMSAPVASGSASAKAPASAAPKSSSKPKPKKP